MDDGFRPIPGLDGYRVSDNGRVQRFRKGEWRDLKASPDRSGYPCIGAATASGLKTLRVHTLVLFAFVGPRLEGMVARHLNDNPRDNRVENLAWGTRSENGLDAARNKKARKPYKHAEPRMPRPYYRAQRGTWCVQIGDRQITLGSDRTEAFAAYHRLMASEGRSVEPSKLTAHQLCDLFLDHVQRHRKASTYGWYVIHLQSFSDHSGSVKAAGIKPLHLTSWLDAPRKKAWGPSTRRGAITAVKRCWAWAAEEGHLEDNSLASVKRPPMGRRAGMADGDVDKVIGAIESSQLRDFVQAMTETGCRPGELSGMTASDLGPECRTVLVRNKLGDRVVTLTEKASSLMSRLAKDRPEGPIFLNTKGRPWNRNALRCAFRKIRAKTGVEGAVPYAFRHLFGTRAIERGVDSLLVAELMGHKDVTMLQQHYAHHKAETLRRAAEKATGAGDGETKP